MDFADKQITFRKPSQVSESLNEGFRALAETYAGNAEKATSHCINHVNGLTEARLTRMRGKNPPHFTRDSQSFITLMWVLLVNGLLAHRPPHLQHEWLAKLVNATDLLEVELTEENLSTLTEIFVRSINLVDAGSNPKPETVAQVFRQMWTTISAPDNNSTRQMPILNRLFIGREGDIHALYQRLGCS